MYRVKIKYDKAINYNREAEGVIKACTSRHHNVLFGIWWANITTIEGKREWARYYCRTSPTNLQHAPTKLMCTDVEMADAAAALRYVAR